MTVRAVPPSGAAATVEKTMKELLRKRLLVGIPGDDTHPGTTAPNWVIGYVMELGDDERHIPARPFLVPGVDGAKDRIAAQMTKAGAAALAGGSADEAEKGLHAAGLIAVNAVRAKMDEGPFAPLAEHTLEARRARGRTGDKPLIDTGALRNSVTYAIDRKGQG